ncbi:MAG: UDP-N-acetylmuramoyl-L-alanine--D-glutamate ligase, partial [Anaerolineae bacterium]
MTGAESGRPFQPDMSWQGVRVTVVGLAREGTAVARFLAARGAEVTVTDMKPAEALAGALALLRSFPIRWALGGHPEWVLDTDIIFVSPGVPRTIPLLVEAARRGVRLSSETELFFSLCPAPIIGITGSSGKTTTTTLVGEILRAAGERTWVGGNIGDPLLNYLDEIGPNDRVVMELSSFQLEHLRVSPHIAAILNITPNHLDRHESMEAYINAKRQIIAHQGAGDKAVFGWDDPAARRLGEEYSAGQAIWFSAAEP